MVTAGGQRRLWTSEATHWAQRRPGGPCASGGQAPSCLWWLLVVPGLVSRSLGPAPWSGPCDPWLSTLISDD